MKSTVAEFARWPLTGTLVNYKMLTRREVVGAKSSAPPPENRSAEATNSFSGLFRNSIFSEFPKESLSLRKNRIGSELLIDL